MEIQDNMIQLIEKKPSAQNLTARRVSVNQPSILESTFDDENMALTETVRQLTVRGRTKKSELEDKAMIKTQAE